MELAILIGLVVLAVPFIVPLIALVSARNARARLSRLELLVVEQQGEIDRLADEVKALRSGAPRAPAEAAAPAAEPMPIEPTPIEPVTIEPPPIEPVIPAIEAAVPPPPEAVAPIPVAEPAPEPVPSPPAFEPPPEVPMTRAEEREPVEGERGEEPEPVVEHAAAGDTPPPVPPPPAGPSFDWESLVGVKLFSAIAGIALVIAAVFFLRYSIDSGWLQPPVRVAIGVLTAVGLLVACELKAARRYRVTANALDAAAIAILFSTFFAAHALWDLIPGPVTFGLLALVTALAVLLSIRHDSLFIAVLGLLGGFATPALLSTGENRPVPLFAYLLLLNVGLAWVAYRRAWPILSWLTLVFTTIYQWGWVFRYLDASSLPLAMGVFILFPLVSVAALLVARTPADGAEEAPGASGFNRAALISAMLPVLFGAYLAAVPEYGARPALLFGFVLLIDAGLLAVAIARNAALLHATGAASTLLTLAIWLTVSYSSGAGLTVLAFTAAFSLLYLLAPAIARWFGGSGASLADPAAVASPLLLFPFAVVAAIEPASAAPWPLFLILLGLVLAIAGGAIAARRGALYHVAAFFAVAAQGAWSAAHLTLERLGTAMAVYALFGVVALAVPVAARRLRRPLEPVWGSGAVLLASLLLLVFLSQGRVAPAAVWALALLLAILNAALFVESAVGRLPRVSQAGSVLSWIVLAMWWDTAAASVGVISSLTVLTGLALVTLAGHAWSVVNARGDGDEQTPLRFREGLYLALVGHLFLVFVALNREWSVPPWPLFGSLTVITLATSAASLATRAVTLHAAGVIATAVVVAAWSTVAGPAPYDVIALGAAAASGVYAVGWIRLVPDDDRRRAALAAAGAVLVGEIAPLAAVAGGAPPFAAVVAMHAASVACLLWLAARHEVRPLPLIAVAPAWYAVLQWQSRVPAHATWVQLLVVTGVLYALFAAYPVVLGHRAREARMPYVAAVAASAMFFLGARTALDEGGLGWMIGVVPVAAGAVLALLMRHLLSLEPEGRRDTGRLALVAGAALAFITVAIPLQLDHQWITIGWAFEGAALAWLYRRIPHRGLLYFALALLGAVFVRLALNPEIFVYEPRGALRILNWYLYTYVLCAAAMMAAAWHLSLTADRIVAWLPRPSAVLPAAAVVLLFLLLNIEIADYYATGPAVTFRFGVTVSQDLTYTIGWLVFGMALLAAGIYLANRPARIAAVSLIAVTTFKCFLYDLASLGGLYRVASFVGLALSLALVSLALQRFVLSKPRGAA